MHILFKHNLFDLTGVANVPEFFANPTPATRRAAEESLCASWVERGIPLDFHSLQYEAYSKEVGEVYGTIHGLNRNALVLPCLHTGATKYTPILSRSMETLGMLSAAQERVLRNMADVMASPTREEVLGLRIDAQAEFARLGITEMLEGERAQVRLFLYIHRFYVFLIRCFPHAVHRAE